MIDEQVFSIKEAIFWIAGIAGILTIKFLSWFMPQTANLWIDKIRNILTGSLSQEVKTLSSKVDLLIDENSNYRREKHKLKGELLECKDAIQSEDQEKLKILKEHYDKEINIE